MRVNYKGKSICFKWRLAEICYDEEKEIAKVEEIVYIMKKQFGWNIDIVADGYSQCQIEDFEDYKSFMEDFKETKKILKKK